MLFMIISCCSASAPDFVPLRRGKLLLKERDFQSLNWDKGEAEADAVVAITGAAVVPARRTAELREVVPTAATDHAVRAGCGTSRISSVSCVGSVPISAPLTYISVHIIQAPIVGTLLTDSFVSI